MSSTRDTNPDHRVKAEDIPPNENTRKTVISGEVVPRKRARLRSITNEAATAKHTSAGRVKEEEMPGPSIFNGAQMPLTHTHTEYRHLQLLLEESYLFREQVIEENERLRDQLHTTPAGDTPFSRN
ncbi:hypothetical protein B0H14DRAFT_3909428 [Mycena olivaceomarginata]|nr:hypothetical protein B0H14DRAFT_3909428 [Mycena olivaceomarginata]